MAKALQAQGLKYVELVAAPAGGRKGLQFREAMSRFNADDDTRVFLLSLKAGSAGLTLSASIARLVFGFHVVIMSFQYVDREKAMRWFAMFAIFLLVLVWTIPAWPCPIDDEPSNTIIILALFVSS